MMDEELLLEKKKKKSTGSGIGAFGVLGLNKQFCITLEKRFRYKQPSAIQRKTIPLILKRCNVVCVARTGSGKTIAYLVPVVQLLESHSTTVGVRCLILLPTRELALQVEKILKKLIRGDLLRHSTLIGGQALEKQFGSLTFNPDIIIATPGRLSQHLVEGSLNMGLLKHFIIDEADQLFEMGFLPDIYKIFSQLPKDKQTILVSATLPSDVSEFIKFGLPNPSITKIDQDMQINEQLTMSFVYSRNEDKIPTLLKVLNQHNNDNERVILFVATKHHVEFFRLLLSEFGYKVSFVYGSMDMVGRTSQMSLFQRFHTNILIVTDLAARGLDLPLVDIVINFDFPHSTKLFIHRIGRTARAGRQGLAISLITLYDFAYCTEILQNIGRNIVLSGQTGGSVCPAGDIEGSAGKNHVFSDVCQLGTVGDLIYYIERLSNLLGTNTELADLKRSMDNSYNLYYKTRPTPSNSSIDQSKILIESLGGINVISSSIHPTYANTNDKKVETASRNEILDYLHEFRPLSKTLNNIPQDSVDSMEKRKIFAQHYLKYKKRNSIDAPKDQGFLVPKSGGTSKDILELPDITLNITPDNEEMMQKQRFKRKTQWNPKKKRYEEVTVDTMTNRVLKNESGVKVRNTIENKNQLKKWLKKSSHRIQKLGEVENIKVNNKRRINEELNDVAEYDYDELKQMYPKHAPTIEAAQLNQPLTHKQKRTMKRLTSTNLATPKESEPSPKKKKKVKRMDPKEFKKKQMKKIAAKGAPGRSKLIIKRKSKRR